MTDFLGTANKNCYMLLKKKKRKWMHQSIPLFNSKCVHVGLYYRKIPIISHGRIFHQKAFLLGLFLEELIIRRNFAFQNGLGLTIKTA